MSRKKQAPKRIFYPDPKYGSLILAKFINFVMYDGKKTTSEKIIYDALKKIKEKTKEDPIKIFNDAVNNIRPNLEVRSRRVGGATYQVPQEVKEARNQILLDILSQNSMSRNQTLLGSTQEVLVEGPARKGEGMYSGRARGNRKVNFSGTPRLIGKLVPVEIEKV